MELKTLNLPDKFIEFAKVVAAAADAQGIREFTLTIRPDFMDFPGCATVRGDLRVNYSSKDGRGRPRKVLGITLESVLTHYVQNDPDSFN